MSEETNVLVDLYNTLDAQPLNIHVHEQLLTIWKDMGFDDMADGIAESLLQLDPGNQISTLHLQRRQPQIPVQSPSAHGFAPSRSSPADWPKAQKILEKGYASLRLEATLLHEEMEYAYRLGGRPDDELRNLSLISQGRVSTAVPMFQPLPVREIARNIMSSPGKCQDIIIEDFETFIEWGGIQNPPLSPATTRERLLKRKTLLEAALPENLRQFCVAALNHIERANMQRRYVNTETMLGDKIEDIPRTNLLVTEDNYAWDMDELAQAILSNGGVMRNPLSRSMFSTSDIRMILAHPLGQRLRLMHTAQANLRNGVRPDTINKIERLGRLMKTHQEVDTTPIREGIDEIQGYFATLPESEQNTIKSLKIPARDGFSGQAFDYTIAESVGDAQSNVTCFHKVGDFLSQAAIYLRNR